MLLLASNTAENEPCKVCPLTAVQIHQVDVGAKEAFANMDASERKNQDNLDRADRTFNEKASSKSLGFQAEAHVIATKSNTIFHELGAAGAASEQEGRRLAEETEHVFRDIGEESASLDKHAKEIEETALDQVNRTVYLTQVGDSGAGRPNFRGLVLGCTDAGFCE